MATNSNSFTGGSQNPNTRTLNEFKSRMSGGGVRSNLFECEITFPSEVYSATHTGNQSDLSDKTRFLIKAANLPASTLGIIDIPFRGRNLKIAGDRTFDTWTITVINDNDFHIRNAFERWINYMNKNEDAAGKIDPNTYQQNAIIYQLGKANINGSTPTTNAQIPILKQYKFYGVFPTAISAIDVSYDSSDTIEEFTVDLQVQWWDALDNTGASQLGTSKQTTP
jgi:hypothetical protein